MICITEMPRTTTRTTYYAVHHTYRLLMWQNRKPIGEALSDLAIYGSALLKIGADGILDHVPRSAILKD